MGAFTPLSGIDGRISFNGFNANLDTYSVDAEAGDIDATGFEDDGYDTGITGVRGARVRCSGYWDFGNNPHATPPDLRAGEMLQNVQLFVDSAGDVGFEFGLFRCLTVSVSNNVKGRVNFAMTGKSSGLFTYPGGIDG